MPTLANSSETSIRELSPVEYIALSPVMRDTRENTVEVLEFSVPEGEELGEEDINRLLDKEISGFLIARFYELICSAHLIDMDIRMDNDFQGEISVKIEGKKLHIPIEFYTDRALFGLRYMEIGDEEYAGNDLIIVYMDTNTLGELKSGLEKISATIKQGFLTPSNYIRKLMRNLPSHILTSSGMDLSSASGEDRDSRKLFDAYEANNADTVTEKILAALKNKKRKSVPKRKK